MEDSCHPGGRWNLPYPSTGRMGTVFAEWDQYLPNETSICQMGPVFTKRDQYLTKGRVFARWDPFLP